MSRSGGADAGFSLPEPDLADVRPRRCAPRPARSDCAPEVWALRRRHVLTNGMLSLTLDVEDDGTCGSPGEPAGRTSRPGHPQGCTDVASGPSAAVCDSRSDCPCQRGPTDDDRRSGTWAASPPTRLTVRDPRPPSRTGLPERTGTSPPPDSLGRNAMRSKRTLLSTMALAVALTRVRRWRWPRRPVPERP